MSNRGLIIVGGGGHATVVAEAAALSGRGLFGFFDDSPEPALIHWAAVLHSATPEKGSGSLRRLGRLEDFAAAIAAGTEWVLGIGDLSLRRALIDGQRARGARSAEAAAVIHPAASCSPTAAVGLGVYLGPTAVVHPRAMVGAHAIINSGAIVEHDCSIGENAHIAPGAVLGGGVTVGEDALVGLGSRILPTLTVGRGAVVGAGAVVVQDVAPGEVVVGVPARRIAG